MADQIAVYQSDHDLLVRLDEKYGAIANDLRELKDTNKIKADDHETRIRSLERQRWIMIGGATAISIVASYLIQFFSH
jgi:hypothetical protein